MHQEVLADIFMQQATEKLRKLKTTLMYYPSKKTNQNCAVGNAYSFEQLKPYFPKCDLLGLQSCNNVNVL